MSPSHLVDQVRRGLAEHPDAGILDAEVSVERGEVVVRGAVESESRRHTITRVLAELAPGVAVRNELAIPQSRPASDRAPEVLG